MNTAKQYPYSIILDGKIIPANAPITDIAAPIEAADLKENKGGVENADSRSSGRTRARIKAN